MGGRGTVGGKASTDGSTGGGGRQDPPGGVVLNHTVSTTTEQDKKIRSKITVNFESRQGDGPTYKITMYQDIGVSEVIGFLSVVSGSPSSSIQLYECYSGKNMATRSGEFPVVGKRKLKQMFDYCQGKPKTLYYKLL